jgi:hypothetical protein
MNEWQRPRIITVEQVLLFRVATLFTLADGRTVVVPGTPIVTNSTDAKRKARLAEQNRKRVKKSVALKKQRNPVTRRIDPASFLKAPLPYSVFKEIDAAAIKKLEGNPRDADGRPITFEEARALAIADFVRVAGKK